MHACVVDPACGGAAARRGERRGGGEGHLGGGKIVVCVECEDDIDGRCCVATVGECFVIGTWDKIGVRMMRSKITVGTSELHPTLFAHRFEGKYEV